MRLPEPDTKSARPGLLVVLIAASLVITTVWFREGVNGPVHRVQRGVQAIVAPVSAVGEYATRPVRGFFAWAGDLGVSRSQLERLRRQNVELRRTVAELEEARLENERLRALLELPQTAELKRVGARVIGRPQNSWENVVLIDRGSSDGVAVGMPVVGPSGGLLGQTIEVSSHAAKVRLLTDQRSGVAALVQATRAEGIARGSIDGKLTLNFVSVESTVKPGDVVITSGMGGVYPKGIVIGSVAEATSTANALYQSITLEPAVSLAGIEEVAIIVGAQPTPDFGGDE